MPPRKRPVPDDVPSAGQSPASKNTAKRPRPAAGVIAVGGTRIRTGVPPVAVTHNKAASDAETTSDLQDQFVKLFSQPLYQTAGVSNAALKAKFGESRYVQLVPIINDLTRKSRLTMSRVGQELHYHLVSDEVASKFSGLDVQARMVYQVIEKAENRGIWTKDIRTQTNIQQQALNKIFKALEARRLIKPIKPVTAKTKKLYMLYDVVPAKEITGGPWYTELEFDHEFIAELRTFIMHCVRRLNKGKGVTLAEIAEKMKLANVSRVQLGLEDVQQLMQTLAFDYLIEQSGVNGAGEALFVAARRVSTMCEFKWWDVLSPDFQYCKIAFEDGIVLGAHEPHHHTA